MMMVETRDDMRKPTRTCVGCARREDADAMVRVVLGPAGEVAVDVAGGASGRGAHVHARTECLEKACKGGLSRSFKTNVKATAQEIAAQIVEGVERRIRGLIMAAARTRRIAIGADATCGALEEGAAAVVIASDAGSVLSK